MLMPKPSDDTWPSCLAHGAAVKENIFYRKRTPSKEDTSFYKTTWQSCLAHGVPAARCASQPNASSRKCDESGSGGGESRDGSQWRSAPKTSLLELGFSWGVGTRL